MAGSKDDFSEAVLMQRLRVALDQMEPTALDDNVTTCDAEK